MKRIILRENLVKALSTVKDDTVSILGVNINKRIFTDTIKNLDNETLELSTGLLSWPDTRDTSGGIITPAIDNRPCLNIYGNHSPITSTIRFIHNESAWYNGKLTTVCAVNLVDYQTETVTLDAPDCELDGSELAEKLNTIAAYAATEENRPVLTGVLFRFNDDKLTLVAADGFRLGTVDIQYIDGIKEPATKQRDYIIPARDLVKRIAPLAKMATGTGRNKSINPMGIALKDNALIFSKNGQSVTLSAIQGNFPRYEQLIPEDGNRVQIMAEQAIPAVKSILPTVKDGSNIIRIIADVAGTVQLSAANEDTGDTAITIDANVSVDCRVALNGHYLVKTLSQAKTGKVDMYITKPTSPVKFLLADYQIVIMPMFVRWE